MVMLTRNGTHLWLMRPKAHALWLTQKHNKEELFFKIRSTFQLDVSAMTVLRASFTSSAIAIFGEARYI